MKLSWSPVQVHRATRAYWKIESAGDYNWVMLSAVNEDGKEEDILAIHFKEGEVPCLEEVIGGSV